MKHAILLTAALTFLASGLCSQQSELYSKRDLIIQFRQDIRHSFHTNSPTDGFQLAPVDELNEQFGVKEIRPTGNPAERNAFVLRFSEEQDIKSLIDKYEETGLFEFVEPDYIGYGGGQRGTGEVIPDDPLFWRQYGLRNLGVFPLSPSVVDADIDMELAWDIEQGDESVIVAVLDAGIKFDHPEFEGRIWTNADENQDFTDTDGNGYFDDIRGWDFAYNDNDPKDDYGHGTNVAGIIAANGNNGIGYAGVDWNCKIMALKILNVDNSGQYSWWAEAIYYAVNNGAKVLNMSVGGGGQSTLMEAAINYAHNLGVTIVACMMNHNVANRYYPAAYQHTIAVGSTDANDFRSAPFFWDPNSGSNFGTHIDIVAPGNYIYGLHYNSNTNYNSYWGGTSQATPLVTGLCALLLAQDPGRGPEDLRSIIRATADDRVGRPK